MRPRESGSAICCGHRPSRRGDGALRGGAPGDRKSARDCGCGARLHRKIGGLHWETGDRERAKRLLRHRAGAASAKTAIRSNVPTSFRRSAGSHSERATTPAPSLGKASARRDAEQGAAMSLPVPGRVRPTVTRAQAYNTLGVALARTGQPHRGGGADRAAASLWPKPRRCRQPVELTRTSASSTARSTHSEALRRASGGWRRPRRWAISASSHGYTRTSRSPTAR